MQDLIGVPLIYILGTYLQKKAIYNCALNYYRTSIQCAIKQNNLKDIIDGYNGMAKYL